MRRLLPLLLLAACVTETTTPAAPTVWYSTAPLPEPPRVGVVDRERIIEAFYDSGLFRELSAAVTRQRERAEAAGDERGAAVLRLQERSMQDLRAQQLDGGRGLTNIIMVLDRLLPEIAYVNGVDIIVEAGTWTGDAKNIIDVTEDLVEKLPAAE